MSNKYTWTITQPLDWNLLFKYNVRVLRNDCVIASCFACSKWTALKYIDKTIGHALKADAFNEANNQGDYNA
jgi:hypothetical protein